MQKKKRTRKLKHKKTLLALFAILIILIVSLTFQLKEKSIKEIFSKKEVTMYEIKDECGVLFNNILHEIENEDQCRLLCINECGVRQKEIYNSEFTAINDSCNTCNCYCK